MIQGGRHPKEGPGNHSPGPAVAPTPAAAERLHRQAGDGPCRVHGALTHVQGAGPLQAGFGGRLYHHARGAGCRDRQGGVALCTSQVVL
jgi:hypothetical protein